MYWIYFLASAASRLALKGRDLKLSPSAKQSRLDRDWETKGLLQKVIDTVEEIADLGKTMDQHELNRLKTANEQRLKMVNKYLPDLKAVEISGDEDSPLMITKVERVIVEPSDTNS